MKFLRTYNEAKSGYPIKKIPIKKSIKKKLYVPSDELVTLFEDENPAKE